MYRFAFSLPLQNAPVREIIDQIENTYKINILKKLFIFLSKHFGEQCFAYQFKFLVNFKFPRKHMSPYHVFVLSNQLLSGYYDQLELFHFLMSPLGRYRLLQQPLPNMSNIYSNCEQMIEFCEQSGCDFSNKKSGITLNLKNRSQRSSNVTDLKSKGFLIQHFFYILRYTLHNRIIFTKSAYLGINCSYGICFPTIFEKIRIYIFKKNFTCS